MNKNDIFRRLRYVFDFNEDQLVGIFDSVNVKVSKEQLNLWLKKEEDPEQLLMADIDLATFLNGLIILRRGQREGAPVIHENVLTNNAVLTKLKIALNLKAEDVLEILDLADFRLGKNELSAFFRKVDHKNYRECKDQVLRNFLMGMQLKFRP